jgi:thiosulfate dehydrogenase
MTVSEGAQTIHRDAKNTLLAQIGVGREHTLMRNFSVGFIVGFLILPLIVLIAASAGLWNSQATAEPSSMETRLARLAFSQSVRRQAPIQPNPVEANDQNLLDGLKIFRNDCAGCHGDYGKPSSWGTTSFSPRVPQFADEPPTSPEWQLFFIVKNGVRYSGMGAWDKQIPDEDIWKVVTFLTHLRSLPPQVQRRWQTPPA